MNSQGLKHYKLPDQPGVYFFLKNGHILYIGKATSLKDRVKSYFPSDAKAMEDKRGPKIWRMVELVDRIEWQETDSVLEALILEAELIKKHQPPYNTREKDDKSYWQVIITDEDFPRVLPIRERELQNPKNPYFTRLDIVKVSKVGIKYQFGPFPYGTELKEALKIVRRIFPYRDRCVPCKLREERPRPACRTGRAHLRSHLSPFCKACFNRQLGLCPGVCTGEISKIGYRKIIKNIKLFFADKKKVIIKNLEREMKLLAKKQEFEKAGQVRNQIFALNHINDVALLKNKEIGRAERGATSSEPEVVPRGARSARIRIEAYDIAHLSGTNTTGAMVVWQDGEMVKSEYKKFKLRGVGIDDPANLREILERRLAHTEWLWPDIVVVDGNEVQMAVAKKVIRSAVRSGIATRGLTSGSLEERPARPAGGPRVAVVAVTKDNRHRAKKIIGLPRGSAATLRGIIEANAEAHRFALAYHRKLRGRLL